MGFLNNFCCENFSCLQKDLKMRYVAAALLTALGGGEVNEKNLKNLLDAVGIDCDDEKAKIVVEQLKGKSIDELLAEGSTKLASMPAEVVVQPVELLLQPLLVVMPLLLPRKRRKRNPKKNLMMIWDSGFSTKMFLRF